MQSRYLHGTAPTEQHRLSLLNEILNESSLRELRPDPGDRVLDVGSGLGQWSAAVASAVGERGRVLGIERSEEQRSEALRRFAAGDLSERLEFRSGDALELPLRGPEWHSFDIAHTRFLLEHLPRPLRVVEQMVRAARPGGRIVLEDDDHSLLRVCPEPDGFTQLWTAYVRAFERLGNDPFIGQRLTSLLHRAGAMPTRSTWLYFGACQGDPRFSIIADNLIEILQGSRPRVLEEDLLEGTQFDRSIANLREFSRREDAAIGYAVCWAEARRPTVSA